MDPVQLLKHYYTRLTSTDDRIAIDAAMQWNAYESACASFFPHQDTLTSDDQRYYALAMAKIEAHYFYTQVISPADSLLHYIDNIRSIPSHDYSGTLRYYLPDGQRQPAA